jgi:hypothetical protein
VVERDGLSSRCKVRRKLTLTLQGGFASADSHLCTASTLLNWPRYIEDQRWFGDRVYPLVVQAGLR